MIQLILHGIGDYYFQTDYQALNKKKSGSAGFWACLKHCFTYTLCFIILFPSPLAIITIFVTHFIIDRTNIIAYAIAIKNNTKKIIHPSDEYFKYEAYDISNFGFSQNRPFAITIWLYIICDNLAHIICNYLALKYL